MTNTSKLFWGIAIFLTVMSWSFVITSCTSSGDNTSSTKTPPETPTVLKEGEKVGEAAKTVGETGKDVATRAEKIDEHTTNIETKAPPETKEVFGPEISGIRTETKGLREDSATLIAVEQKLKDTQTQLLEQQQKIQNYTAFAKESEIQRQKLQDKIKELESSNAKMLRTMLSWIVVVCVIGIGASLVIGFFFKTPAAFMVAAGCVATMGIAVAVTLYLQQIAWVALAVLGLGFLGAVVYVFFQIKNRDTAVKELVHTGEIAKTYLPPTVREKIFGNAVEPGVAHQIQSGATMQLVNRVRSLDKTKRGYGLAPSPSIIQVPALVNPSSTATVPSAPVVVTATVPVATASPKTILG